MPSLKQLVQTGSKPASPIISVVAGNGRVAKSSISSGADLIIALNAGLYRHMGYGSLTSFMPFHNSNDQTEELLRRHILPHTCNVPVVAGIFSSDPTRPLAARLARLKEFGVEGVTNWPAIGFFDGAFRAHLEDAGLGIASEIEMLKQAKKRGFVTFGFVLSADDAYAFAKSGVDALILNVGITSELEDIIEKRNQLQLSITKGKEMLASAHKSGNKPFSLVYGGAITEPEDFAAFLDQVPIDGYAGGSAFERFPLSEVIDTRVGSFKDVILYHLGKSRHAKFGQLIGSSKAMKDLFQLIQKIAPYDVNVCIDGESGTGKELVATQIHALSPRKENPFITVNCGAIPDTLIESEFFGYEKGAFTGAVYQKPGKFELADKGTLFLDEIADLSLHAQAALLRVIQQGEVVRLGGQKPISVDVRIVCASNQNLAKLVQENKFRVDLYFRLSAIVIKLPPLRDRKSDIPLLVANQLDKLSLKFDKKFVGTTAAFMERLKAHSWPGNVRELEQVITRHAIIEEKPVLEGDPTLLPDLVDTPTTGPFNKSRAARIALDEARQNKTKAAASLGISRKTLYQWLNSGDGSV